MYENETTSQSKSELNQNYQGTTPWKIEPAKNRWPVNRTKGFVNLNRFKSGRAIKRLNQNCYVKHKKAREEGGQDKGQ